MCKPCDPTVTTTATGKPGFTTTACLKDTETLLKTVSRKQQTITSQRRGLFELAVLRSAIPASEWNTLDDVIASKIPADDAGKPWIWLQKIKEHYVGASTLMQDRYHFWVKMSQANQTSITAWETTVRTAAGRCSFGTNADEFMRDKFLFGLNESFTRFREDIFYRDGQRKPDDPPFTLAFVVNQALSFEAAQQTNKLLATSATEEQVHYTASVFPNKGLPNPPGKATRPGNRSCFFCGGKQQHSRDLCPAFGKICSYCHKSGHFANVCQQAARNQRPSRTTPQNPTPRGPRRDHIRLLQQNNISCAPPEDGIQDENCFTLSDKQPPDLDNTATTPPSLHPPIAGKGHFVMLDLWSPDSCVSKQIPFQIDSAASCNTLPSNHLSDMPWATISPSKTVILPYASPPIKPIGQVTLTASKGSSACDLTFQIINTAQPALLSIEASKALGVLTLNADFIRKCSTSATPPSPMSGPIIHQDSAAGPLPAPPNTSDRIWPELGALTLKFISENCPSLFQGLGFLGPPVDFDLDPNVRPIHGPTHRQPVSKLDSIKAALNTYEATGQLIRVSGTNRLGI